MKILTEQTMLEGKPADKAKAIISGRMNKLIAEATLVGQQFVKDQSKTIKQYLKEHNLEVLNFIRFEVGEGIEKKEVDFAKEVANQIENK
jgi:elongation factor Ts